MDQFITFINKDQSIGIRHMQIHQAIIIQLYCLFILSKDQPATKVMPCIVIGSQADYRPSLFSDK